MRIYRGRDSVAKHKKPTSNDEVASNAALIEDARSMTFADVYKRQVC